MKKVLILILSLLLLACCFVGCKKDKNSTNVPTVNSGTSDTDKNQTSHVHNYESIVTAPTCTQKGYTTYKCSCDHSYADDYVDAIGHYYVNGVCSDCGETEASPSEGLEYTLAEDNSSYILAGIGICTDTDIVIPNIYNNLPVTEIKREAFAECSDLTSVSIPENITRIGNRAFYNCKMLNKIYFKAVNLSNVGNEVFGYAGKSGDGIALVIGSNVVKIPSYLFTDYDLNVSRVPNITSLKFERGSLCESIESLAFIYCNLADITLPNSLTSIGDQAFYSAGFKSITRPDSVTSIGERAFYNCGKLEDIKIGKNTTHIGNSAFGHCRFIQKIYFNASNVDNIGSDVFGNCGTSIGTKITIGKDVTQIPNSLFRGFSSEYDTPVSVSFENGSICEIIGDSAFSECLIVSVILPDSITHIGSYAFSYCDNLAFNEYDNAYYIGSEANPYMLLVKAKNKNITSCTIYENSKFIHTEAFIGCEKLESITIPNSVISIGSNAFYKCQDLDNVYITDIVSWCNISFKDYPFWYADNLYLNGELVTDLVIPEGVTSISDYAFRGCSNLTSITIPNSVTSIGNEAFASCSSLTNITIPDSVTSIGENAFQNCNNLNYYEYENAYYLGNYSNHYILLVKAKENSITNCTINNVTKFIYNNAFENCTKLEGITIPSSIISIGDSAFKRCINLTTLTILEGVTTIGNSTFEQCESLTNVTIPNSVISIGELAFNACSQLNSVVLSNNIVTISSQAFGNCTRLKSINIPDTVTSIGYAAFMNCKYLEFIIIPESVTSIGYHAFDDCKNLTIYCEAVSQPEGWDDVWKPTTCNVVWGYTGE